MKKKLLVLMLGIAMVFTFAACGGSSGSGSSSSDSDLAKITTDKDKGTVTINAKVNGDVFGKSTMHFVVNKDGKMADKSMLQAYCTPEDFYNAMKEAGGKPWNTSTDKIKDGEYTGGQKVDVTLTWDGHDDPVSLADCVKADKGDFKADMRFSGNLDNNKDCGSGCIACLNSCWAGITSNKAYAYNDIDSGKVKVTPNEDVLPDADTNVQVTFTLK